MTLNRHTDPNELTADEGMVLYDWSDQGEPPYYFEIAYLPNSITIGECRERFAEVSKEELATDSTEGESL